MRILTCFFLILLCSCKKTDNPPNTEPNVEAVNAQYFIKWNAPYATGTHLLARSEFSYEGNKPVKRSGSYLPVPGGYDYSSYTSQVYDTVVKINNQKFLLRSINKLPSGSLNPPRWEIEVNDDKPTKRISYVYRSGNYIPGDTAIYFYDANKRV